MAYILSHDTDHSVPERPPRTNTNPPDHLIAVEAGAPHIAPSRGRRARKLFESESKEGHSNKGNLGTP